MKIIQASVILKGLPQEIKFESHSYTVWNYDPGEEKYFWQKPLKPLFLNPDETQKITEDYDNNKISALLTVSIESLLS